MSLFSDFDAFCKYVDEEDPLIKLTADQAYVNRTVGIPEDDQLPDLALDKAVELEEPPKNVEFEVSHLSDDDYSMDDESPHEVLRQVDTNAPETLNAEQNQEEIDDPSSCVFEYEEVGSPDSEACEESLPDIDEEIENPASLLPEETMYPKEDRRDMYDNLYGNPTAPPRTSKCRICSLTFPSLEEKKAHVMTHHKVGRFKCDQCADVLKTKENLFRHKMVHVINDNENVFLCQFCHGKFKSKPSLSSHLASVHAYSGRKLREATKGIFKRRKRAPREPVQHHCEQCLRVFHSKSNLKRHIKNIHDKDRPHKCDYCDHDFASKYNGDMHMYRVHLLGSKPTES